MKKYIRKPIEIEAIQLTETNIEEILAFVGEFGKSFKYWHGVNEMNEDEQPLTGIIISTFNGTRYGHVGDYIVKNGGEFYPCSANSFKQKYEILQ